MPARLRKKTAMKLVQYLVNGGKRYGIMQET
ncbi:hypothetical protein ACK1PH_004877, partial [Salmonella enterica]